MKLPTRHIQCATAIVFLLSIIPLTGCHALDVRQWTSQDSWYSPPPPSAILPGSLRQITPTAVTAPNIAPAESLLASVPAVPLSVSQAKAWGYQGPESSKLYLVRAVSLNEGTGAFRVTLLPSADIVVTHDSLGHYPVPMKRRPIIVELDSPPRNVYVTCSMAE